MGTERQRCEALTVGSLARCHKPAMPGERFRWVHLRYPPRTVAEPTSPTAKRTRPELERAPRVRIERRPPPKLARATAKPPAVR